MAAIPGYGQFYDQWRHSLVCRDCNPGLEFSIPGFGIVEFPIPGSRDPVGIGVLYIQTTKIATWVTVFAIFELQVCTIVLWI